MDYGDIFAIVVDEEETNKALFRIGDGDLTSVSVNSVNQHLNSELYISNEGVKQKKNGTKEMILLFFFNIYRSIWFFCCVKHNTTAHYYYAHIFLLFEIFFYVNKTLSNL